MRFGAWIPSFAYPNLDYARTKKDVDTFARKANSHDIDLWTIDHLLHAPGLYGMSWLEPLHVATWAAAVAPRCLDRDRNPGVAGTPSGGTGEGGGDDGLPLWGSFPIRDRSGLVSA